MFPQYFCGCRLAILLAMLRVGTFRENGYTNFALSGRIEERHVSELKGIILEAETEAAEVLLDLEEVKLVNREAVKFLAACEGRGIKLINCPSYIRAWIRTGEI